MPSSTLRRSMMRNVTLGCVLAAALALSGVLESARAADLTPPQQAFRDIYKELVEINTTELGRRHRALRRGDGGAAAAPAAFPRPTSR